jgi:hypothetical protein
MVTHSTTANLKECIHNAFNISMGEFNSHQPREDTNRNSVADTLQFRGGIVPDTTFLSREDIEVLTIHSSSKNLAFDRLIKARLVEALQNHNGPVLARTL